MRARRGQSILEYTMIIGIVTVVLMYMGTGIKRGVQSVVKVTADQVGNQQLADQDFTDVQGGYMVASNAQTNETSNKQVTDQFYTTNTIFNDNTYTMSNTITNAGFSPTEGQ